MAKQNVIRAAAVAALVFRGSMALATGSATPTFSVISDFGPGAGQYPTGAVFSDSAGNIFGTTAGGGTGNNGIVFELPAGTTTVNTIAQLAANGSQGSIIRSIVPDSAGNLYGVTQSGGANNDGAIFKVAAQTGIVTALFSFNGTNGSSPEGSLTRDSSGNLFGTTSAGGTAGLGTVFELSAGSNVLTTLANFTGTNGSTPEAGVVLDGKGNLYGTTSVGGTSSDGEIFKLALSTKSLSTVVNFSGGNGSQPWANLVADPRGNGTYYSTTTEGGASNHGTVFTFSTTTNTITNSVSLNGVNGSDPMSAPVEDSNGDLFGSSVGGGANDVGSFYEVVAGTNAVNSVYAFTLTGSGTTGDDPNGGIAATPAGNLFGTNYQGGPGGRGTLFEITGSGFAVPEPKWIAMIVAVCPMLMRWRFRIKVSGQK